MDRTAYLYEKIDRQFGLESLAAELEPAGLRIERPGSGVAVACGPPTYYSETTVSALSTAVRLATEISFSLWWSQDTDVYCQVLVFDQVRRIQLELPPAEHEPELAGALGEALRKMATDRIRDRTLVGYVFDQDAVAEEADWNRLFIDGELPAGVGERWQWPRVVLARAALRPVLEGSIVEPGLAGMLALGPEAKEWRRG